MSPVTHFLSGWVLAAIAPDGRPCFFGRREKALIVAAAVAPDLDGLGLLPELLTRHSSHPLLWFSQYHHRLHTLSFALICTAVAYLLAGPLKNFTLGPSIRGREEPTHPGLTSLLVFLSFHLHLLCDLVGSRGPDGEQWPIPYLSPFSHAIQLTWSHQWALNGWQNFTFTGLLVLATLWLAWKFAVSPIELFSVNIHRDFVRTLRRRFPGAAIVKTETKS